SVLFFFQAEDGIRDFHVTGVQTCALPILLHDGRDLADAPEGGETDSHPTFSPDGAFVVFAHGTSSHATDGAEPPRSALYLVGVEIGSASCRATADILGLARQRGRVERRRR